MKEQKEPQEFLIQYTEKHHAIAFLEDLKKQGYIIYHPFEDKNEYYIGNRLKEFAEVTTYFGNFSCHKNNFTLPDQWKEASDFTNKQMQLYKELQKPKSKEQQLYDYFADNHDIQLLATDIQEIERILTKKGETK